MAVADEVADDRKPLVYISVENSGENAGFELPAKAHIPCYRDVLDRYCAFRGVRLFARLSFRFGGALDLILRKIAERRVGEERNEPFLLPTPFGLRQTHQDFRPRAPARLTSLTKTEWSGQEEWLVSL